MYCDKSNYKLKNINKKSKYICEFPIEMRDFFLLKKKQSNYTKKKLVNNIKKIKQK